MKDSKTNPAYGLISINKGCCRNRVLYGSRMKHDNIIQVTIKESYTYEEYGKEHYFGGKEICSFEMSPAQWAHLVSSFNEGEGTPITFSTKPTHPEIERIPMLKHDEFKSIHTRGKEHIDEIVDDLKARTVALTNKITAKLGSLSKKAQTEITQDLKWLNEMFDSNIRFAYDTLLEESDNLVATVNSEVESIINTKIHNAGITAISNMNSSSLIEDKKDL